MNVFCYFKGRTKGRRSEIRLKELMDLVFQSINQVYFHFDQYMLHHIKTNINEWRRTKETFTGFY